MKFMKNALLLAVGSAIGAVGYNALIGKALAYLTTNPREDCDVFEHADMVITCVAPRVAGSTVNLATIQYKD